MRETLRAALEGVIDYAGLFPPAQLDMPSAVAQYSRYLAGPEAWILNRFVCPASRLAELAQKLAATPMSDLVEVNAIGTASKDRPSWEDALAFDAEAMNRFNEDLDGKAEVFGYEVRIPEGDLAGYLEDLEGFDEADVYAEVPVAGSLAAIEAIAGTEWLRAKARTGGDSVPSAEDLATFMNACIAAEVPFKLTAGLHHPLPGRGQHGFLNVVVAAALLYGDEIGQPGAAAILADDQGRGFVFDDDVLGWGDFRVDLQTVQDMRDVLIGFGSCSVEEPLRDLASLGWTRA